MDIRKGLKIIENTKGVLFNGNTEIVYHNGNFWLKDNPYNKKIQYIPIEFELLDWKIKVLEPTLKEMLSKLRVKEFEYDDFNYFISYNPEQQRWDFDCHMCYKGFGITYYNDKDVRTIIDYMNDNKVSWDEFIKTWEEIQRERGEQ